MQEEQEKDMLRAAELKKLADEKHQSELDAAEERYKVSHHPIVGRDHDSLLRATFCPALLGSPLVSQLVSQLCICP